MNTLGIDVSTWDGTMNWTKASSAGAKFAFIRAGSINNITGVCYKDYQYDRNIFIAPIYMPVGCYWYFRPNHDEIKQADYMIALMAFKPWKLRPVIDVEENGGLGQISTAGKIVQMVNRLHEKLDIWPIVYTRATFWDPSVAPHPLWSTLDLWAARYNLSLIGPWSDGACKFRDWTDWKLWQFSADGNGRGAEFGSTADSVDLNYFNGDEAALRQWAGLEPTPPVVTLEDRVGKLETEARARGWEI